MPGKLSSHEDFEMAYSEAAPIFLCGRLGGGGFEEGERVEMGMVLEPWSSGVTRQG